MICFESAASRHLYYHHTPLDGKCSFQLVVATGKPFLPNTCQFCEGCDLGFAIQSFTNILIAELIVARNAMHNYLHSALSDYEFIYEAKTWRSRLSAVSLYLKRRFLINHAKFQVSSIDCWDIWPEEHGKIVKLHLATKATKGCVMVSNLAKTRSRDDLELRSLEKSFPWHYNDFCTRKLFSIRLFSKAYINYITLVEIWYQIFSTK